MGPAKEPANPPPLMKINLSRSQVKTLPWSSLREREKNVGADILMSVYLFTKNRCFVRYDNI